MALKTEAELQRKIKSLTDRMILKQQSLSNLEQRVRSIKQGKGHSSKVHEHGTSRSGKRTYVAVKLDSTKNVLVRLSGGIKNRNEEIAVLKKRIQEYKSKLRELKPELNNTPGSKLDDIKNKYKNFIASIVNK